MALIASVHRKWAEAGTNAASARWQDMKKSWLIINSDSGSYDPALCERIRGALKDAGWDLARSVTLPEDDMPGREELEADGASLLAIFSGDGTINAAVQKYAGWDGDILVLPGGTMNLLSRKLHGDADAEDIVSRLSGTVRGTRLPVVEGAGAQALVGVIAGPTTSWAEVREDMRHRDVGHMTETLPNALSETFGEDRIRIAGGSAEYPAIFLEPGKDAIDARGFTVEGAGEMAQHGWAWITGDFREGPGETLPSARELTIEGGEEIGLLIDGEKMVAPGPVHFRIAESPVRFVTTL